MLKHIKFSHNSKPILKKSPAFHKDLFFLKG